MTIAFDIQSDNHLALATKDRTGLFMGKPEFVLGPAVGEAVKKWCESGAEPWSLKPVHKKELAKLVKSSTLDDSGQKRAEARIDNCKTESEYLRIKEGLLKLQTVPV